DIISLTISLWLNLENHYSFIYIIEIDAHKCELRRITQPLTKLARRKRALYIRQRRIYGRMVNIPTGLQNEMDKLQSKRNRLLRSIKLAENRYNHLRLMRSGDFPVVEVFDIGKPSYKCVYCGAIMWKEESTKATRNSNEPKFSLCCRQGKVKLPPRRQPPEVLNMLLQANTSMARHFLEHIRGYNAVLAFTSIGGKLDRSINNGRGVYVYSIGGQVYHRI
ncbi:unnamed protein product, partial [Linum tenue]